jgi:hypothetical protein
LLQALETIGFVESALRLSTAELKRQGKPLGFYVSTNSA